MMRTPTGRSASHVAGVRRGREDWDIGTALRFSDAGFFAGRLRWSALSVE